MATYRGMKLPAGEYLVLGLVDQKSISGQGDMEYHWTWLCRNPQSEAVLVQEVYNISWWDPAGPNSSVLTGEHLYSVTETALPPDEALAYQEKLKRTCGRSLPLPFAIHLPDAEKFY